jgi:small conductance mechanosensitive channel
MGLEQHWANAAGTVVALVTTYGLRVIGAIFILIIGWMSARLVYRIIVNVCARARRVDQTVTLFLANGARYSVLVFTFVAVLTSFGIATTSFVAVLGALGIAIGLALQGTLSNLAAGIMLILFRPFHIGDRIEASGVVGTTREINLFYSELDTDDNVRAVIPNGLLWGAVVKISSRNDSERLELKFTRPLSDDVNATLRRLKELVARDQRIRRTAELGVLSVNESTYVLVARLWVARRDAMQVAFDLNRAAKEEFDRGIPPRGQPGDQAHAAD